MKHGEIPGGAPLAAPVAAKVAALEDALREHFQALVMREAFMETARRRASGQVR